MGALGRSPDNEGFSWWLNEIRSGRHDLRSLAAGFIYSEEFQDLADTNLDGALSNEEFLTHMFVGVFGREPDEGGYNFWIDELNSGNRTQERVLVEMTQANEYVNLTLDAVTQFDAARSAASGSEDAGTDDIDTMLATVSFTLTDFIENLVLDGSANIDGTGNELDNEIVGNSGNNTLSGRGGNDTLEGGEGNDTLEGGEENDTLEGGEGDDTVDGGEGIDVFILSGNSLDDYLITESDGTTTVFDLNLNDGDDGTDKLFNIEDIQLSVAASGENVFISNDFVRTDVADDVDEVIATISYTLTDFVENLTLDGADDIDGTGERL